MANYSTHDIQETYIAFFGRPAEPNGLDYWLSVDDILGIQQMHAFFANQIEYRSYYADYINSTTGAITDAEGILNAVYQNLFNRNAEPGGKNFWIPLLTSGAVTIDNLVTEVLNGAQNIDLIEITSKLHASEAFTNAIKSIDYSGYAGTEASGEAHHWLQGIIDSTTLNSALQPAALQAIINQVIHNGSDQSTGTITTPDPSTGTIHSSVHSTVSISTPEIVTDIYNILVDHQGNLTFDLMKINDIAINYSNGTGDIVLFNNDGSTNTLNLSGIQNAFQLSNVNGIEFGYAHGNAWALVTNQTQGNASVTEFNLSKIAESIDSIVTLVLSSNSSSLLGLHSSAPVHHPEATSSVSVDAQKLLNTLESTFISNNQLLVDIAALQDIKMGYTDGLAWVELINSNGSTTKYNIPNMGNIFDLHNVDHLNFSYTNGTADALITNTDGTEVEVAVTGIITGIEHAISLVLQ